MYNYIICIHKSIAAYNYSNVKEKEEDAETNRRQVNKQTAR